MSSTRSSSSENSRKRYLNVSARTYESILGGGGGGGEKEENSYCMTKVVL
jgi:hypothetical protein